VILNPRELIAQGFVTGVANEAVQIQPNGIDFTLDVVHAINTASPATISERGKTMRPIWPLDTNVGGFWQLCGSSVYDGASSVYVKVPPNCAAVLFTRSTLTRNGVFLVSGLYDDSFEGHVGFTIYTPGGSINIERGTRVGQIVFMPAESAKQYAGGWNHAAGTHYTEEAPNHIH